MIKRDPGLPRFAREPHPEMSLAGYLPVGPERRETPRPQPLPSAPMTAFAAALDRLEETIDMETDALIAHRAADMEDINNRKSRSLLELTRLARALPRETGVALRDRLARLQGKLSRNQAVLKLNLEAVREIADLLLGALGEAESDGTYGVPLRRPGAA